jgi:hypothetical protein
MSLKISKSWPRPAIAVFLIGAAMCSWAEAPVQNDPRLEWWKFDVSIVGYVGAVVAFLVGLRQYRRAEYWKRSQFLAQEMKEFFADPRVENARMMIDWGVRDIPLLRRSKMSDGIEDSGERTVDRQLQCQALRPHDWPDGDPIAPVTSSDNTERSAPSSDAVRTPERASPGGTAFEPEEAAIRDCYDRFLDGFERFGNYLRGDLVSVNDLKPYVQYWVDDIVDTKCDATDSLWCVFLFAYIEFYAFEGVKALFDSFGHDIGINSELVKRFVETCSDPPRAGRLLVHVRKSKAGDHV